MRAGGEAGVPLSALAAFAVGPAGTGAEPFLFFRASRGHFSWWSGQRTAAVGSGATTAGAGEDLPAAFARELAAMADDPPLIEVGLRLAAGIATTGGRQIWICSAPALTPADRAYAAAAMCGGWAVLREPAAPPSAPILLWARPTLLTGDGAELSALFERAVDEAPRWRRASWLRRRLARLRTIVVDDGELLDLEDRVRDLGCTARVITLARLVGPASVWPGPVVETSRGAPLP